VGVIASNVYPLTQGPKYIQGNSIAIAFTVRPRFGSLALITA
jgi:hypothetical protein